ncbi:MAG: alginate export family protein, partial [Porphyrobacter sp.]|nr:alginate export family protein [Porphyrobacter sp.]
KPSKRWDGFVAYRALWLDSATDSFAFTGVRDPSGASGKFAGHQVEARARYWLVPKMLRLETGGAVLFNGRFLDSAPNANGFGDPLYGYVDLTLTI